MLIASTSLMAQNYQWHEIFSNQEKLKSQQSFNEIQFNAEGESFVCGVYGNIDNSNAATWMGDEFVSQANYTGNSYNKNYLLSKFDANDNLLWTVYGINGCFENSNADADLAPTADGGVVALLKVRFSQGDKELAAASDGTTAYPLAWIVDADGDTTKIDIASKKWPYQGIIAKFSSNGRLTAYRYLWVDYSKGTEGFTMSAVTTDAEGNIYIAGVQAADMAIGSDTIRTTKTTWTGGSQDQAYSANCNGFIIKLDADLNYTKSLTTSGSNTFEYIRGMKYSNGSLYLYGTTGKTENSTITLADKSAQVSNSLAFFTAKVSTDLESADYLTVTNTCKVNNVNIFMYYGMTMAADGNSFYYTGGMLGGLITPSGDTISAGGTKSGCYNAVVLKFDAATGLYADSYIRKEATTNALGATYYGWKVMEINDSIYIPGWSLGTMWMHKLTKNLDFVAADTVATTGSMSATIFAADNYEGKILLGLRNRNNSNMTVGGTTINKSDMASWYGVLAAYRVEENKTATGLEQTDNNRQTTDRILRNGAIYIRRNGNVYTVSGQRVK